MTLEWRTLLILTVLAWPFSASASEIRWEVVNRLPLLEEEEFSALAGSWHRMTGERSMRSFLAKRMIEKAEQGDRSAYLLADPKRAASRAQHQLHDIGPVKVTLVAPNAAGCNWTVDPAPTRAPVEGSCSTEMVADRDVPYSVSVKSATTQAVSTVVMVKDVLVVAMGDSYSSGEGAPDRPAVYGPDIKQAYLRSNDWYTRAPGPTPAEWFDQTCHRSLLSWQPLAALRLAMQQRDVVVRLLYTSCSGAEFFDGLLIAQSRRVETEALRRNLVQTVDGEGKRVSHKYPPPYLTRSQVNTVRDHLCEWETDLEDVTVDPRFEFHAQWRSCNSLKPKMAPDVLLITAGGNDVNFSGAVGGTLLADKARSKLWQPFLDLMRGSLNLITPDQLRSNIDALAPSYSSLLAATARGAKTPLSKTILMRYPNPIGTDREAKGGGIGNACYAPSVRDRIGKAFTAFSVAARDQSPLPGSWAVEFVPREVNSFANGAFPALERMLDSSPANQVAWLEAAPTMYDNRLLCTDEKDEDKKSLQLGLEPLYFCHITREGMKVDRCTALELSSWNSELPGRRMINTTNDAILIQRTWAASSDVEQFLVGAGGTFHPTAEAHSVAADSAFGKICKVLETKRICTQP